MEKIYSEIVVIGGGAAGMAAAVTAAQNGAKVLILERLSRVGKKLLLTGNGRCNLGNLHIAAENYHGSWAKVLELCTNFDTIEFFRKLGLYCRADASGRLYPYSNHATSVLDTLRFACERYGVQIRCDSQVTAVTRQTTGFMITCSDIVITADKVIFAVGGSAAPSCGTDGSALKLLESLGVSIIKPYPALVPLRTAADAVRSLKGLRVQAQVSLYNGETCLKKATGEVQFADSAISGICVFDLSRFIGKLSDKLTLSLNLLPEYTMTEVCERLTELAAIRRDCCVEDWLTGLLPKRIAQAILKQIPIAFVESVSSLTAEQVSQVGALLIDWRFPILGCGSWQAAQVTAGGVAGSELTDELEVAKIPGLYVVGEAVDIDGICGGYNLQWAWASGHLAGLAAIGRGTKHDTY